MVNSAIMTCCNTVGIPIAVVAPLADTGEKSGIVTQENGILPHFLMAFLPRMLRAKCTFILCQIKIITDPEISGAICAAQAYSAAP